MDHQVDIPPFTLLPGGYTSETWKQALGTSFFPLQIQHRFDNVAIAGLEFLLKVTATHMPIAYGHYWPYWLRQLATKLAEDEPFRAHDYWRNWTRTKVIMLEIVRDNGYRAPEHTQACEFFTAWHEIIPTKTPPPPKLILSR